MTDYRFERCGKRDRSSALGLLFGHHPPSERAGQVAQVLAAAAAGTISLDGLCVCHSDEALVGAMLAIESQGRTVAGWPPRVAPGLPTADRDKVYRHLIETVCNFAQERRARLVQAILEEEDLGLVPMFLASHFFHLAHLVYLRRPLAGCQLPAPQTEIEYVCYRPRWHEAFLDVLGRSYQGSLDCPEINGARMLEEIIESHRAQGQFDPQRWFLARRQGQWVGCLLLAGLPDFNALEIAYVAVLPEARGTGLGRELTRKALREGIAARMDLLTLAVDARNQPARQMYAREGFEPWDERDVYLRILDPADGKLQRKRGRSSF